MPESRQKFISGLIGGVTALALPLAALADPPLEKFKKDEVSILLHAHLNHTPKASRVKKSQSHICPRVSREPVHPQVVAIDVLDVQGQCNSVVGRSHRVQIFRHVRLC